MLLRVALVSSLIIFTLCQEAPPQQDPTLTPSTRVKVTPRTYVAKDISPTVLENVPDTKDTTQEASTAATTRSNVDVEDFKTRSATLPSMMIKDDQMDHQDVPLVMKQEPATEPHISSTALPSHDVESEGLRAQPTEVQDTPVQTTELAEQPKEGQQEALPAQPTSIRPEMAPTTQAATPEQEVAETTRDLDPLPPQLPQVSTPRNC